MNILKENRFLNLLQCFLAVILALVPFVIKPVCRSLMKNGLPMPCHYSGILITVLALVVAAVNLLAFCLKKSVFTLISNIVSILLIALAYLLPSRIITLPFSFLPRFGLCQSAGMSCRHSFHWVTVLIVLIGLVAVIQLIILAVGQNKAKV
ncbi:MAG: DUF4418 family protein [Eubacteriales bacterium]|nr:DUF4418 family protein [Eubacteriales bacterium]